MADENKKAKMKKSVRFSEEATKKVSFSSLFDTNVTKSIEFYFSKGCGI